MSVQFDDVDIPINAEKQIELQDFLSNLSPNNVDNTADSILESNFVEDQDILYELCTEIKTIHRVRPFSTACFSKLIKHISDKLPNANIISHIFEPERPIFNQDIVLLNQCFQDGIVSEEFIVNFHKHLSNRTLAYALYFTPYIKYFDDYIKARTHYHDDRFQEVLQNYEKYSANDFEILRNCIEFGWDVGSLGYIIKFDESDKFIVKIAELDNCTCITLYSPFEYLIEKPVYIFNLAALYGSVSIFKYLIASSATLPLDLPKYAIMGGNYEIIRLCMQAGLDFSDSINTAVEYHRNEIFNWLTVNGIAASTFYSSVMKDNLLALIYFISQGFNVKFNENEWSTPLHMAVSYGSSAVIDFLISSGCDWKAVDENGWRPLDLADSEYQKHFINHCINRELLA
ncbi:hypothetical protein TVAG_432810 [Trichomonas vaginalis G3]|uniref:DUF3447 domain-containing protein n=1 Tax=Trichomonas vaginalis (strain ATCC PRA-98 / G3) TaxID=412133 RepID=A2DIS2_TRIV3|nr:Ankyrin repeat family [Trichomonas vaginalis G3]EAY19685.1 hypothetical protein TVAG_432810 [Trichomonas vaginalis G3]KAI5521295.1 Ankyrin repeat family [Trichomonas vaginalis G3]|eukprot:XP_001580671.1 hypothetical protein [Trichomonas vaginalis G3]